MSAFQPTETDRRILAELARDARLGYKELAERVGIPTSTCHGRVRLLEQHGVIRGYRADVSPGVSDSAVDALIRVSVQPTDRSMIPRLSEALRAVPGVQQVFLVGGDTDLVVHVRCPNVAALRALIAAHLGSNPHLAQTHTSLVFEHLPGLDPLWHE